MEKQWIYHWMKVHETEYRNFSKEIWDYAETGLAEYHSARQFCQKLEETGFQVKTDLAGIPTAFMGSFGQGKPVIAVLGEFDALEGMSQQTETLEKAQDPRMENGHGCGHNLLGTAALAAAAAIKEYMQQQNLSGTIRFYGCPGEEKGCGKVYMVREGCFEDVDAVLTWHPMDVNQVEGRSSLADLVTEFHFIGKSAHAAASPHLGRSALDAVELMNIGCNYMREHIPPQARIHYAVTDTGGTAPNIVQASARVVYEVRAPKLSDALALRDRICKAAEGAALMTETEVEISYGDGYSDYIPNHTLNQVLAKHMRQAGIPDFTEKEKQFAAQMQKTMNANEDTREMVLHQDTYPYIGIGGQLTASTDVGDVSYAVPTAQLYTACFAYGTPGHSWQMVSQAGSSIGQTGMLAAARVLALTGAELLEKNEIVTTAAAEHKEKTKGHYVCPIAPEKMPDIDTRI